MTTEQQSDTGLEATALDDFMSAMQRLFKIGVYYPTGHAILDKATDRFMAQLQNLAGNNASVTLQIHDNTLLIEGVKANPSHPFIKDFSYILSTLGIAEMVIDREIAPDELHTFARQMLASKFEVVNTKQFCATEY